MKWISALQLAQWADSLAARAAFPAMIGDLIRASVDGIDSFRFPSGDKGQVRGFDGFLEVANGFLYVPSGRSVWEFGVSAGPAAKAEGDFIKRSAKIEEKQRKQMTFVFASPRTWDNPQKNIVDWVNEKKSLNEWADVKYIDGAIIPLTNPIRDDTKLPEDLGDSPKSSGAPACEIEVTPEMIEAGANEFYNVYDLMFHTGETAAISIFKAMLLASTKHLAKLLTAQGRDMFCVRILRSR